MGSVYKDNDPSKYKLDKQAMGSVHEENKPFKLKFTLTL